MLNFFEIVKSLSYFSFWKLRVKVQKIDEFVNTFFEKKMDELSRRLGKRLFER